MSVRDKSADSLVNGKNGGSVEKEMPTEKILLEEKKSFLSCRDLFPRETHSHGRILTSVTSSPPLSINRLMERSQSTQSKLG